MIFKGKLWPRLVKMNEISLDNHQMGYDANWDFI